MRACTQTAHLISAYRVLREVVQVAVNLFYLLQVFKKKKSEIVDYSVCSSQT